MLLTQQMFIGMIQSTAITNHRYHHYHYHDINTRKYIQLIIRNEKGLYEMGKVRIHQHLRYHTNTKNKTNTKTTICSMLYNSLIQITCEKVIINILSYYSKYNINFLHSEEMMSSRIKTGIMECRANNISQ